MESSIIENNTQKPLQALMARRELIGNLVSRNLKIRYKSSFLGFFWSLLTPLCSILIYAVFAKLLKFGGEGYLPYLISGIIVWQFTVSCMNDALNSIVGNSNLVKKVFFPRIILPLSTCFANAVNFLLTFVVLLVYLIVSGNGHFSAICFVVPAFLLQLMLCMGFSCLSGTLNVFFRDTEHIIGVATQAWFFLSPIMYPFSMQADVLNRLGIPVALAYLNPMTGILALYRKGLLGLPFEGASFMPILVSALVSVAVFSLGIFVLSKGDKQFGDVL